MSVIEVKNLRKKFGEQEVLKGINFSLEKGEVLSVIGSSGNGKTTLLRCLTMLETADEGEIFVNGEKTFDGKEELTEKQLRDKRRPFGLVFQSFNLFPQYTALDNVKLALATAEKDKAKAKLPHLSEEEITALCEGLLKKVGLGEKMKNYPCELSGGQQQRVAIARAMALKPQVLCFDEPTSALDPELTGEVLKVIKDLKNDSDITMIIVTHEMQFAKNVSDKIAFMSDGKIEEYGSPEQVFGSPKSKLTEAFLQNYLKG